MSTSEERREVARELRRYGFDVLKDGSLLSTLKDVTGRHCWRDCLIALADLIDPTCSMTCKGSFTAHHDFTRWECGECGAYAFAPKKVFAPRFCPNCGARVVSYDEACGD